MATSTNQKDDVVPVSEDPSIDIKKKSESEETKESQVKHAAEQNSTDVGEGSTGAEVLPIPDTCVDHLTQGLLDAILPHFQKHDESLSELTRNQVLLIETLQQENRKFSENKVVDDLTKMMFEAKVYQGKLTAIKKEMTSLHEKSSKLKKKALKLQQQKMKENLEKEQQREREIEEDRKLTAKRPTTSSSNKTAPHR
ncbi:biogenesis of lysosome-related organelles complex 1 subunit 6-like [Lytechinus variegatus]|uniref:biogenesis of lysosome-related organelles complex 1 subunit 6-like n=1 Tax=Lytechinus variegatus TaxID=7654 RepID=UPI001BB10B6A|nr:biogenesis of lysosome-related organelles complex 1 subunit 6-like [Lytechinus variegatus]